MLLVAKRPRRTSAFGQRLRRLREQAGLTQTALGEMVGITYQNIAKYERDAMTPTWPVVVEIAKALQVPTDAFLEADPDQPDDDLGPPDRGFVNKRK